VRAGPRVGGLNELVLQRLTGRLVTEPSAASATGLLDLGTATWHPPGPGAGGDPPGAAARRAVPDGGPAQHRRAGARDGAARGDARGRRRRGRPGTLEGAAVALTPGAEEPRAVVPLPEEVAAFDRLRRDVPRLVDQLGAVGALFAPRTPVEIVAGDDRPEGHDSGTALPGAWCAPVPWSTLAAALGSSTSVTRARQVPHPEESTWQ
jgi:hypothetical protein